MKLNLILIKMKTWQGNKTLPNIAQEENNGEAQGGPDVAQTEIMLVWWEVKQKGYKDWGWWDEWLQLWLVKQEIVAWKAKVKITDRERSGWWHSGKQKDWYTMKTNKKNPKTKN